MKNILVVGAGKIGSKIAEVWASANGLLASTEKHQLILVDSKPETIEQLRIKDPSYIVGVAANDEKLQEFIHGCDYIISAVPYYQTLKIAKYCKNLNKHYFDLTEDVDVTNQIKNLAEGSRAIFMPQCGLAPGAVSIITHALVSEFDEVESVKIRVGALPQNTSNIFKYNLTWSTEGLINEYCKTCFAIKDEKRIQLQPLDGLEKLTLYSEEYEAFNTSGGLGSLVDTYLFHNKKVKNLDYKSIRYPGHHTILKFLMEDLRLREKPQKLKELLEDAIPTTEDDLVLIYINVVGRKNGRLTESNYTRKINSNVVEQFAGDLKDYVYKPRHKKKFNAIELSTAIGVLSLVDLMLNNFFPEALLERGGFVRQEEISYHILNKVNNFWTTCY